jgi:peptidoglycan/LPS O-acetylase OafA/YrhL
MFPLIAETGRAPVMYRPDVDGLRAVAVLAVILFHLDRSLLPGGVVGVDIFFTISGFLITRQICAELEDDRFSLLEFYRRRVKRIAPAMLVVVFVTVSVTQALMLPEDARAAAKSAFWSLASLANVFFWRTQDTSYFATRSEQLPLLHLWSLGVEEQFYLLWPVILLACYKAARVGKVAGCAAIAAIGSFLLAELLFDRDPLFSYYMLPTRAGELLLGALVAIGALHGIERRVRASLVTPIALCGALLVAATLPFLSQESRFPGLLAIPPTLGTALTIVAGLSGKNPVSRALSLRPLVWIGQISYSMYLWHWPILAIHRYGHGDVGPIAAVAAFALTLLLSWITYVAVEQPIRRSTATPLQVIVRCYLVPAGALQIAILGVLYPQRIGLPFPSAVYRQTLEAMRRQTRPAFASDHVCQRERLVPATLSEASCVVGANPPGEPSAILWGDSNASHYVGMLEVFARTAGFRFRNVEVGACPPVDGDVTSFVEARRQADCRASMEVVRPAIDRHGVVIIASSWSVYHRRSSAFLPAVFQTVRRLANAGKYVILLGKVPDVRGYDRLCPEKGLRYPLLSCPRIEVPPRREILDLNQQLRQFATTIDRVTYFDATTYLCPQGRCRSHDVEGKPQFYDESHLTLEASEALGAEIVAREGVPEQFARIARMPDARPPARTTLVATGAAFR